MTDRYSSEPQSPSTQDPCTPYRRYAWWEIGSSGRCYQNSPIYT